MNRIYTFFILLFILSSCFKLFSQQVQTLENLKKAQEFFLQLEKWQKEKNWQEFFSHRTLYLKEIKALIEPIKEPLILKLKAGYLYLKLASLLELKDRKKVEENFLKDLKKIRIATPAFLSFLKKVLSEVTSQRREFRRKFSHLYIELLKKSTSPQVIKKEAENFYDSKDIESFSQLGRAYLNLIENSKEFKDEIKAFIEKSICDGFRESCSAYFAEELFSKLKDLEVSQDLFYLRAYNLEKASEYEKAALFYRDFLERFPDSSLKDEVLFRLAYIYMYKLRDFSQAKIYFSRLKDRGFGMQKHLDMIEDKLPQKELSYNEKVFLKALKGNQTFLKGKLLIGVTPSRVFTGQKLQINSVSFSPDTGCLVPESLFLWSGDLGQIKIATNTPSFSTSFKKEGFKIINLVEIFSGEHILGSDSCLINVYRVDIYPETSEIKGEKVRFEVELHPYLPQSFLEFAWRIEKGGESLIERRTKKSYFSYEFSSPSNYNIRLSIYFLGKEVFSEVRPLKVIF